jgi:site-specific recombinase XerD
VARGKGNKERRIPVGEKLAKSVKRYLKVRNELVDSAEKEIYSLFLNNRGHRVSENTVRRNLYKYVRQSRLRKTEIHPHDLRRTFATWYLQENPAHHRELAELMGHSDLSQVMKYALSDAERARAGVAKL